MQAWSFSVKRKLFNTAKITGDPLVEAFCDVSEVIQTTFLTLCKVMSPPNAKISPSTPIKAMAV